MKILLIHNDYGRYSGEEAVVDKMAAMFAGHGHEVCFYRRSSAGLRDSVLGQLCGFFAGIYSPSGVRGVRDILQKERPDIVNVHNLYPFISPAALFECKKAGVPVVMTVHNFRLMCPTGLFMRDGKPCELCLEKQSEWNCLRHNCENSLIKSAGYALRNAYARLTNAYKKNVDAYVCITDFQRQKLTAAGYDKNKLFVIPNSLDAPDRCEYQQGNYVAYCGRISTEKGIDLLFEVARRHPDIPFHLAGYVRDTELTTTLPSNCLLLGYLNQNELKDFYTNASFFVMASKWYEGFPMTVLEAAGFGKPTVAPNHGGFTDIVGEGDDATGKLFAPGDVNDLERKIIDLWNNPAEVERLGEKSFRKLKAKYDSEVVYSEWERLIRQILLHRKTQ